VNSLISSGNFRRGRSRCTSAEKTNWNARSPFRHQPRNNPYEKPLHLLRGLIARASQATLARIPAYSPGAARESHPRTRPRKDCRYHRPPVEPKLVLPAAAKTPRRVKPSGPVVPSQTTVPNCFLCRSRLRRAFPTPTPRVCRPSPSSRLRPLRRLRGAPDLSLSCARAEAHVSAADENSIRDRRGPLGTKLAQPNLASSFLRGRRRPIGIYELGALGPLGKVGISYLALRFLLVGGIYLEKTNAIASLAAPASAGGWALLFFSTYADSSCRTNACSRFPDLLDCILMLIVAIAMGPDTLCDIRSQFVNRSCLPAGLHDRRASQDTVYGLTAGANPCHGLVSIVLKMGWFELCEVFGISPG